MHARPHHSRERADRGQALFLVLAIGALLATTMVAIGQFGVRVVTIEHAQVAADAAALAGVAGGRDAAAAVAARNHGTLVSFRAEGDEVLVVVVVRAGRASARASRAP